MDTQAVVKMIDAITEGRDYNLDVQNARHDDDDMTISFRPDEVTFHDNFDSYVTVESPRVAREIAGALVAWATRKEVGENITRQEVGRICVTAAGDSQVEFPSVNDWADIMSGRSSREEWYRQNVGRMTLESKRQNYDALHEARKTVSGGSQRWDDITKAMRILEESMDSKDYEVKSLNYKTPPENCTRHEVWHISKTHRRRHYMNGECSGV